MPACLPPSIRHVCADEIFANRYAYDWRCSLGSPLYPLCKRFTDISFDIIKPSPGGRLPCNATSWHDVGNRTSSACYQFTCHHQVWWGEAEYRHCPTVLALLQLSKRGVQWDDQTQTPFFEYELPYSNGTLEKHVVYFEDGRSLRLKYEYAKQAGVQGISMWTANSIDNSNASQVADFWGAVRAFTRSKSDDNDVAERAPVNTTWRMSKLAASTCRGFSVRQTSVIFWP